MTTPYRLYLLRMWVEPGEPSEWRALLKRLSSGEGRGFVKPEDLSEFLKQEAKILEEENAKQDIST